MSTEGEAKSGSETRSDRDRFEECRAAAGDAGAPLGGYLRELGFRIIKSIAAVAAAFIVCFAFGQTILDIVTRPHELAVAAEGMETDLRFYSYVEPITAQLKASLFAAAVITAPWLVYQVWADVASRFHPAERRRALRMVVPSVACLFAGVAFGYFFVIPATLGVLLRTPGPNPASVVSVRSYLSLFFLLMLGVGVAFQIPVVVWYLLDWDMGWAGAGKTHDEQPGAENDTEGEDTA